MAKKNLGSVMGWTPLYVMEGDGSERMVQKLHSYIGGGGTAPTINVGKYLKDDGTFTSVKAEAANVKGDRGDNGWAPVLASESYSNGKVSKIIDWTGGEGDKPTLTGYIGATGIVADIADAVVYGQKGDQGDPGISTTNMTIANRLLGSDNSGVPGTPKQMEAIGLTIYNQKIFNAYGDFVASGNSKIGTVKNIVGGYLRLNENTTGILKIKFPSTLGTTHIAMSGTINGYGTSEMACRFLIILYGNQINAFKTFFLGTNHNPTVRKCTEDDGTQYVAIGTSSTVWPISAITVDSIQLSGTGANLALLNIFALTISIEADVTGTVNLTRTENRPAFNPNQVMSDFVTGTNTAFSNTDTLNQMLGKADARINARLTQAQASPLYAPLGLFNPTNGLLVRTDIIDPTVVGQMFILEITENTYTANVTPARYIISGYITNSDIARFNGFKIGNSGSMTIYAFVESGVLCFWFQQLATLRSHYVSVIANPGTSSPSAYGTNRVVSISNTVKPTTGVTKEVSIIPTSVLLNNGLSTDIIKGDGTYQALATLAASTATKLATPRTINGVNFDGTANITIADSTKIPTSEKGANNGVATLDASGKLTASQVPAIAITDTTVVSSQSAMLALTAQVGDVAVRSDLNKSFILKSEPATTLANWQELLTPTGAVSSVNGRSGAVTLTPADVGVLTATTTISSSDATTNRYKSVTITGATVGMCVTISDPILYQSTEGRLFRLYGRVISENTVYIYIQSFALDAGTSDAVFHDYFNSGGIQNLDTGDKTITIKLL